MQLSDVARTGFAARQFTDEAIPDEVLHRFLDMYLFVVAKASPTRWLTRLAHNTVESFPVIDALVRDVFNLTELSSPS